MPEKTMLPADFSDAPISLWRRSLNFVVSVAAIGAKKEEEKKERSTR